MLKVVCFKWAHRGGFRLASSIENKYTADHVNRLYRSVTENLSIPHEFICITDDPTGIECKTIPLWDKCLDLGGCYNRLYVFSEDMKDVIGERFACIDLDCVITGSLDEILGRSEDFVINQYLTYRPGREQWYNGGLFLMDAGARKQVWDTFDPDTSVKYIEEQRAKGVLVGTDQAWISHVLGRGEPMFGTSDGVYNFYSLPNTNFLPEDAKMVLFAGSHDPTTSSDKPWVRRHYFGEYGYKGTIEVLPEAQQIYADIVADTKRVDKRLSYCPNIMRPATFNEKVLWRKHFVRDRRMIVTTDKYLAKAYAKGLSPGIEVIPTLAVSEDPDNLELDKIPTPYMIKPTHRSGAWLVVRDTEKQTLEAVRQKCRKWLSTDYGQDKFEWPYAKVKRRIMIEPLMSVGNRELLQDYKFYMIHGKCELIQVSYDRDTKLKTSLYSPDWKKLPVKWDNHEMGGAVRKPARLAEMISHAEKLASGFAFIRIDLYVYRGKVYIGEFTHFPNSGSTIFTPEDLDHSLGRKLKMSK